MNKDPKIKAGEEPGGDGALDPVAEAILAALAELGEGKSLTFKDIAQRIAEQKRRPKDGPELWRRYLMAVKQQARHLARKGRIEIVRKGAVVDPDDFKGIVRLRLKVD